MCVCVRACARVRARACAQSVCAEKGGVCMHHSIAVYACTETYGAVSSTPNSDVALGRHQESTLFEFWERDLGPYQHSGYVPVKADFSDLIEKVEWAITHDDDARAIARNGAQFVREHLHMTRVHCYWARLLSRYSALQDFKPQVPPDARGRRQSCLLSVESPSTAPSVACSQGAWQALFVPLCTYRHYQRAEGAPGRLTSHAARPEGAASFPLAVTLPTLSSGRHEVSAIR